MLRTNLVEVVRDKEGLQIDLEEMRYAMREESQKLYPQISEEAIEDMNTKRRQLEERLEEKNCLVTKLCNDIAALQESAAQATSCEDNIPSHFAEKIDLLENEAKEKNEKLNKIKAVAVKGRKELDASKKVVSALKEEVESLKAERDRVSSSMKDNLQMDYDGLTEQLDKERERAQGAEGRTAEITKQLDAAMNMTKQLEAHVKEAAKHREGLEAELLTERVMKEQKI
ncbi:hypothetical protein CRUP_024500, partial [Coryphaenoides rupestris]